MLLFVTKTQVGNSERTFITGVLDDYSSVPKYVNLGALLSEPKYHNIMTMVDCVTINYSVEDEIILPVVEGYDPESPSFELEEIVYLEDPYDIRSLGDMVRFDSDDFNGIDEILAGALPNYSSRDFKAMCLASSDTLDNLVGYKFRYNLNRKVDADVRAVADKYNSESKVTGVTTTKMNSSNITLPMERCDSELYIEIPKPYYNRNMVTEEDVSVDFVDLSTVYKALNPYKDNMDACSPVDFKKAFAVLGKEAILGNAENNDLPIQNNERRFYTALNKFIERSLKMYLEAEDMYSEEEFSRRINNNVLPTHVELILESFIRAFVNINWRHSPNVPVNEFTPPVEGNDDDDDNAGGGDSAQLSGDYRASSDIADFGKMQDITHYMTSIKGLLSSNLTAYAWSEVIVKLARWGERKPTHLKLTEEESGSSLTMLNLFKFESEEDLSYLKNYDCVEIDGCKYIMASLVVNDAMYIADSSGMIEDSGIETYGDSSMCTAGVLGVRCLQIFETSYGQKRLSVYMSLDSIIDNYNKGINKIYGLDLVDGRFVVDEEVMKNLGGNMKVTDVKSLLQRKPDNNSILVSPRLFEELQGMEDFSLTKSFDYTLFGFVPMIIPEVNIRDFLSSDNCKNDSVRFAIMSKFKCDMQFMFLPSTDKGTLESAINIYNEFYSDIDFSGSSLETTEADDTMDYTSLFSKNEPEVEVVKHTPIFRLLIGKEKFYICKLNEVNNVGCDKVLLFGESEVNTELPAKEVTGTQAMSNACIIAFKNKQKSYGDKIFASEDVISKLDKVLIDTYNTDISGIIKKLQNR